MKKVNLLLLATLFTFSVFAQQDKGYVYLKNGSIIKGKYSYLENQQKLRIESSGNIWIFETDQIDSISTKRSHVFSEADQSLSGSKFFFRTELGVLAGNSENSQSAPFSISASANYRLTSLMSVGLGLGLEFFNETYTPVFANFEYKLRESSSTPYLFLKAGYQFPTEESNAIYYDVYPIWSSFAPWPGYYSQEGYDTRGGILVNPGVGYQQMITRGFGMNFAVGYQFHRLNYEGENDYSLDIDYNRLSIKIGIIF
ncbi:hypothetical protein OU798_14925 [Prolixibacteraceae bacterium Z1-6]|uniref:Outer membrane protein beta-barrel domain-containing protein n=1 Tax=Draconibacterium aestuarii TaxID=2998507 RepID=A0A9X3FAA6_9BACT|nr:hypothetical protein [Prolixibacteraceae bacterium Z1-6]